MPPKFGTSGLRGLVVDLTPGLVSEHVRAFLAACEVGTGVFVGRDLRPSSPDIADMVIETVRSAGIDATDCGAILTPGLALAATKAGASAVMITGSHIPADRNGLKFYTPSGEITKEDEAAILGALGTMVPAARRGGLATHDAAPAYVARYTTAFGADCLAGMRIGVYTHSTVGRDVLIDVLSGLGADARDLARSDTFIPVDTEAVPTEVRQNLKDWAKDGFDAIVSMDGDGDRPLLADETGDVVPGDILGQITAQTVQADAVVTPISSNSAVLQLGFDQVLRTRIGSPFVIAGMQAAGGRVVGYEANGGFLMGFDGVVPALATRDAVLPLVSVLSRAKSDGGVARLVAQQPALFTAADRLQEVPTERSRALIERLDQDPTPLLAPLDGSLKDVDRTDGLRLSLTDGRTIHLRPSGNAPELRCYVEDTSKPRAADTLAQALTILTKLTGDP